MKKTKAEGQWLKVIQRINVKRKRLLKTKIHAFIDNLHNPLRLHSELKNLSQISSHGQTPVNGGGGSSTEAVVAGLRATGKGEGGKRCGKEEANWQDVFACMFAQVCVCACVCVRCFLYSGQ